MASTATGGEIAVMQEQQEIERIDYAIAIEIGKAEQAIIRAMPPGIDYQQQIADIDQAIVVDVAEFAAGIAKAITAIDFFTVHTIDFRVFYCFIVLKHDRRRIVLFNVTMHPTAAWTAYLLRINTP